MQEPTGAAGARVAWITGAAVVATLLAALAMMSWLGGGAGADAAQAAKSHPMPKKPISGGCYAVRPTADGGCGHHQTGCFYGHAVGGKPKQGKKHPLLRPMTCVQVGAACIGERGKKNKHDVRRPYCVLPPAACAVSINRHGKRRKYCVRGSHGGMSGIISHKTKPPGPNWKFPKHPKSPMPVIR